MIIGIDIDDTIADTYEVMFNYAQEFTVNYLKRDAAIKQLNDCKTHMYIKELFDWNNEEDMPYLEQYYEKIIINTKPKTLAIDYLNKLKEEGNKIVIITARWTADFVDVEKLTREWIEKYRIPCDKLIINAENKLIAAKQENIDMFIDDSFKNCKAISDSGIKTYIMDTRVNRAFSDEKIERVFSWPHLYQRFQEYKKEV